MTTYIIRRLVDLVLVLFGVSILVFLMIRLIPGDAVAIMLGAQMALAQGPGHGQRGQRERMQREGFGQGQGRLGARMAERLDLTDDQQEAMDALRKEGRAQTLELRKTMMRLRNEMRGVSFRVFKRCSKSSSEFFLTNFLSQRRSEGSTMLAREQQVSTISTRSPCWEFRA